LTPILTDDENISAAKYLKGYVGGELKAPRRSPKIVKSRKDLEYCH
jgi:hypothetical protein